MKTAAKVFIILGMIVGALGIIPLVIGAITLNKMKAATCKADVQTWGILSLIFCSLLGGIFLLCCKDEDFQDGEVVERRTSGESERSSREGFSSGKEDER